MDEKFINQAWQMVNGLFQTREGKPFDMTYGQCLIFSEIFWHFHPRVHVMTYTQYGKSETIAMAVLARSLFIAEPTGIVAGTKEKAQIIMDYIIQHIFDNTETARAFILDPGENIDYIRRYRNKRKLTFEVGEPNVRKGRKGLYSEIYVQSAEEALGFGAKNVIEDESSLVSDSAHGLVMRMLGGFKEDNFLCKVGNPFERNHFLKSFKDPEYHKIVVTGEDGVEEGRIKREQLDEMKKPSSMSPALYSILYECKFPDADAQDEKGFMPVLNELELDRAKAPEGMPFIGEKIMGIDIADGGDNFSSIWVRGDNVARRMWKARTEDPLIVITKAQEIAKALNIPMDDDHVFPDKTGNVAVCARMNELYPFKSGQIVNNFGVVAGEKPEVDDDESLLIVKKNGERESIYLNRRAQMGMRAAGWIQGGGKIDGDLNEALEVKWKMQTDRKIKFKSKEDMRKDDVPSPDDWDAFCLTFAKNKRPVVKPWKQSEYVPQSRYGL